MKKLGLLFFSSLVLSALPAFAQKAEPPAAKTEERVTANDCADLIKWPSLKIGHTEKIGDYCIYENIYVGDRYSRWSIGRAFVHMPKFSPDELQAFLEGGSIRVVNARPAPEIGDPKQQAIMDISMSGNQRSGEVSWHLDPKSRRFTITATMNDKYGYIHASADMNLQQPSFSSLMAFKTPQLVEKISLNHFSIVSENASTSVNGFLMPWLMSSSVDDPANLFDLIRGQILQIAKAIPEQKLDSKSRDAFKAFVQDFPFADKRFYLNVFFEKPLDISQWQDVLQQQKAPEDAHFYVGYGMK